MESSRPPALRRWIDRLALRVRGLGRGRGREVEVLDGLTVGETMQKDTTILREHESLAVASERLFKSRNHGLPVVDDAGALVGILTVQDIDRVVAAGRMAPAVGDVCTRDLLVAHPDETLAAALRRMSVRDVGRLPVVSRDDPRHLVGILRRGDVIRAYDAALTRREALRHRAQQARLGRMTGVDHVEIRLEAGAPAAGRAMREVHWPLGSVVATLRRGRRVLVPRGETTLQPGDVLAILAESGTDDEINEVRRLCQRAQT
jgi:CIC family chloride channel protein